MRYVGLEAGCFTRHGWLNSCSFLPVLISWVLQQAVALLRSPSSPIVLVVEHGAFHKAANDLGTSLGLRQGMGPQVNNSCCVVIHEAPSCIGVSHDGCPLLAHPHRHTQGVWAAQDGRGG